MYLCLPDLLWQAQESRCEQWYLDKSIRLKRTAIDMEVSPFSGKIRMS